MVDLFLMTCQAGDGFLGVCGGRVEGCPEEECVIVGTRDELFGSRGGEIGVSFQGEFFRCRRGGKEVLVESSREYERE